jgi:TonB-linked SusC/RagA family outer membrane protein
MRKLELILIVALIFISNIAFSQSHIIKGTVTYASDRTPVAGASVMVKGTNTGTITHFENGNYELDVPVNGKYLVFSYLGYKTVEKEIGDNSIINVLLEEDVFRLEEVVVSGVATATPKKNLTISVEKVDAGTMKDAHAASAVNALQSRVAGLQVTVANGLPGGGASLRLRGSTSLTGNNSPLIILDGNRIHTNLADINLDDIESFEVVKGASAAALYGSEAGNGAVVLISKRGKNQAQGKSTITVRSEYGFQQISKFLDVATHHPYKLADNWEDYDYTRYKGVYYIGDYIVSGNRLVTDNAYADQPFAKVIDHQELFFKKGEYHTEYVGINGSGEKSNYLISFENNRQEGIINYTGGYQRNNLKFNFDRKISDKFNISTSNLLMYATSKAPSSYESFQDLLFLSPDVNLLAKNADSTDFLIDPDPWKKGLLENPLYALANKDKSEKRISIIGNILSEYYIFDWLKAEAKYSYEYRNKLWTTITPKGYLEGAGNYIGGSLYKSSLNELAQDLQFTLHFNKQIKKFTHKLKFSYLFEKSEYENFSVFAKDFTIAGVPNLNNVDPKTSELFSSQQKIVTIDYFGIYDVDYDDKYLFSGLYRIDGSSLFGSEVRWNPYFRVSGGYRITEDFKLPKIDELKLRIAYGSSGQRPGFDYQYEVLTISNGNVPVPHTSANKYLKPSTTKELEFGLNMDFLKRFSLEVNYAIMNTHDAIALAPQASHIGTPNQYKNVGSLSGKSLEANLGVKIFNKKRRTWSVNLIFDRIRQKIDELIIPPYFTGPKNGFYIATGETFGIMYGSDWVRSLEQMEKQLPEGKTITDYQLNSDGYVIPVGTEGTIYEIPINIDTNKDGLADKVQIGNGNPNFNLALNNTFSYKGLSLGFVLAWKKGGNVYNFTRQYAYRDLAAKEIDQYGKPDNEKKAINYYSTLYKATEVNSHFVEDGSYLKIREISLGYAINENALKKINGFVKSVRIGLQLRNAFTISNYSGYDPEVASGNDLTNFPFDNFGYPNFRTYSGSINITF